MKSHSRITTQLLMLLIVTLVPDQLCGQNNNNNNNNAGGIQIDADGVIRSVRVPRKPSGALKRQQAKFAEEVLPPEVVAESAQRTLSLTQLDSSITAALKAGSDIPVALQFLGGLYRIDFVTLTADDVLLTGPAEGFGPDLDGRMLGNQSGRPILNLDDLIVALRSITAGNRTLSCSIDPTSENLARLQQYIRGNSAPTSSATAARRFANMGNVLGLQEISIEGVPKDSHFALTLVEADLRMKRISLGVEPSGIREIRSHLSLLAPQGNSLQRWWFMPLYDPLETNEERSVFKLSGQRAQLMAQEEISNHQGERSAAATTRQSTERFAQLFTQHFAKLADTSPVFAELQNLYDWAVVAALIEEHKRKQAVDLRLKTLLTDEALPVQHYTIPTAVPSASNFKKSSRGMLVGLIGGVTIDVRPVIRQTSINPRLKTSTFEPNDSTQTWFWDQGSPRDMVE